MGDALVIGSCSGNFYVLDRHSGALRWSYDIHQDGKQTSFHGDPLIKGDTALVGTDLSCAPDGVGHVYAFNARARRLEWKQKFNGIPTPIVRSGDTIFFGSIRGDWYAADANTGAPKWQYQIPAPNPDCKLPRAPVILDGKMYIVGLDDAIHIVDTKSGKPLGTVQPPSRPTTALLPHQRQILFGTEDNRIYSFDPATRKFESVWQFEARPADRMQISGDSLLLFLSAADRKGFLASLDLKSRKLRWIKAAEREWASDWPRLWHNQVLAGNCRGHLSAFSVEDGRELWSQEFQGCIRSIGTSDDLLYVGAQQGMLYGFAPRQ